MADSATSSEHGMDAVKRHLLTHKIQFGSWLSRIITMVFTFLYFVPIFTNPYQAYYKALAASAVTSALRLHQRRPQIAFSRNFLTAILWEDSFHYLLYSILFLYVSPFTLALVPVFLFSLIHFSSYSLELLDILGQNSWWGARLLISLVELQSRNILMCVAFFEIILMPFTILFIFLGRAGLHTPFLYYQFVLMRYRSRRNPSTRYMFHSLKVTTEGLAQHPMVPGIVKNAVYSAINFISNLAPAVQQPPSQ